MLKALIIIEIIRHQQGNFTLRGMDNGKQGLWLDTSQPNFS
jgi:hypothetical protein